jgi:hypothetical protein
MAEPARCIDAAPDPAIQVPPRPAASLDTAVKTSGTDIATALQAIAREHNKPLQQVVMELARLSFGPGKLAYDEYMALRLFDDRALAGADKSQFVGLKAAQQIWLTANADPAWFALVDHKLAITTLLSGYGFATIPTAALFTPAMRLPGVRTLCDAHSLAAFLRTSEAYPLFGKPIDSNRSLGSASIVACESKDDCLVLLDGRRIAVADFAGDVARNFAAGYLLQPRVEPDAAVRAICGDRLACVRVMTIHTAKGPELLRAIWKIPSGTNVADNFWRAGNIICEIDLATGRTRRAITGNGLASREIAVHPDTGAPLAGIEVPGWTALVATACEAAAALREVRLIGWDMAATARGPVIVEPNNTPDFFMVQFADRRGLLDERFKAFIGECEAANRARAAAEKAKRRSANKARLDKLSRDLGQG